MPGFRRNRRRYKTHAHKLSPLAIAGICVAATLVVSLVTGLVLRAALDEETFNRLNKPQGPKVENPVNTYLPDVNALPFTFGNETDSLEPAASRAVMINSPSGMMHYTSPVTLYFGMECDTEATIEVDLIALDVATTYVSGIFHPQAFLQETADLRYAVAAREQALLREFVRNGGNEVLLVIDDMQADSLSVIADYVGTLKQTLGSTALGVALTYEQASSEQGWEIIGTLLRECDFCALDLRLTEADGEDAAKEVLTSLNYYLQQYDMRLLLSEEQTDLIAALENSRVTDYAIVSAIPPESSDEPTPPPSKEDS